MLSCHCDICIACFVCSGDRVQEIMDDDQRESGRIPRTVECELTADLGTITTSLDLILNESDLYCELSIKNISITQINLKEDNNYTITCIR